MTMPAALFFCAIDLHFCICRYTSLYNDDDQGIHSLFRCARGSANFPICSSHTSSQDLEISDISCRIGYEVNNSILFQRIKHTYRMLQSSKANFFQALKKTYMTLRCIILQQRHQNTAFKVNNGHWSSNVSGQSITRCSQN